MTEVVAIYHNEYRELSSTVQQIIDRETPPQRANLDLAKIMRRVLAMKIITKNLLGYSLFIFIAFECSVVHHNCAFGSQKAMAEGLAEPYFNSGVLPDNFVSIHIKDVENKTTYHHVGGIMIHPGVILTSWGRAWGVGYGLDEVGHGLDGKYQLIKVKRGYRVYSENELEIVFHLKQGGKADKKVHFEVKKIINHASYFDNDPIFQTIALLFFEPNESIAHISSLPLEYQLILDIRELYSQKTDEKSSKENISLFYCTHSANQAYFCTEPRAADNSRLSIAYQCPQHIGYPVMWQPKPGVLKVLGLTSSSPFMQKMYSHFSAEMKKEYHIDKKELAHSLLSLQYNLIDSHRWIKASLIDYWHSQKNTTQPFKLDQAVMDGWDFSLDQQKNAFKGYPFMVVLGYKLDDNDGPVLSCRGVIIHKGVILTAAHCLEHYISVEDASKPPLYASFHSGGKEHFFTIDKVRVFPEYVSALTAENKPHYQHDLALIFYRHHEELPEVAPLPLNRQLDLYSNLKPPGQFLMISSHATAGFSYTRKRDKRYSQVSIEVINTEEDYIDYLYSVYPLLKLRGEQILLKTQESLKENLMSYDLSFYLKKIKKHKEWRERYNGTKGYRSIITLPDHAAPFIERNSVSCHGDSGSPVIYNLKGTLSLVGINSQVMTSGIFKLLYHGAAASLSVPIKPYLHWISETIKAVHQVN